MDWGAARERVPAHCGSVGRVPPTWRFQGRRQGWEGWGCPLPIGCGGSNQGSSGYDLPTCAGPCCSCRNEGRHWPPHAVCRGSPCILSRSLRGRHLPGPALEVLGRHRPLDRSIHISRECRPIARGLKSTRTSGNQSDASASHRRLLGRQPSMKFVFGAKRKLARESEKSGSGGPIGRWRAPPVPENRLSCRASRDSSVSTRMDRGWARVWLC